MDKGLAYFVRHSVAQAKEHKASLIIFEIDTPGGAVGGGEEYTIGICNAIDSAAPIPTAAFVKHWAWSAGVLVSISADKIVMKQIASIGAAEVVGAEEHQEKYTSAIRTEFKARAEKKGYPANLVMAMVDKDMEVREVTVDGKREFLTPNEITEYRNRGKSVEEVGLVVAKDKLLALSANDALKYGLAAAIKETREEVPALFGIKDYVFKESRPTWSEHLVMFLTSPVVSGILILVGLIAAGMSLKAPGLGLPEITAIVAFTIVFFGHYLIGLSEATEVVIFVIGIGLLAVELFLLPGFGVAGISGIVLIMLSLILAMQDFTIPDTTGAPWQWEILQRNFIVVGVAFLVAFVAFIAIVSMLPHIPVLARLTLPAEEKESAGFTAKIDYQSLVGKTGISFTPLRPAGKIKLETGELLDVVTDSDFIGKDEQIKINQIEGNRIVVTRI